MTPEVGRNDPCPCGSGKKYKKCCMLKEQPAKPLSKALLDQACRKATPLLLDFAVQFPEFPKKPPLKEPVPALPDAEAQNALNNETVLPWLLYLWYPPDSPDQGLPSERTIAARFLRQQGQRLDGITRRFIEAACSEPFSYWELQAVSPGASLLLKDMITGEERVVLDVSLSNMARKWDIFFAQVVGLEGTFIVNGMGIYPLYPEKFRQAVAECVGWVKGQVGGSRDRIGLLRYQGDFIAHYLKCVEEVVHPRLPELVNMDGDKLVFAKSRYTFQTEHRSEIVTAIGEMSEMEGNGEEDGENLFVWDAAARHARHDETVSKASIKVGADYLESGCNSEKRDKALRKRLLARFKGILTHESTNLQPFNPGKRMPKTDGSGAKDSGPLDLATLPEKARKQVEGVLEKQHMSWLEEKVPMLGGKTPRQAVKSAEGRKQVAEMINDWENLQLRDPHPQFRFDFNKLRRELGIEPE